MGCFGPFERESHRQQKQASWAVGTQKTSYRGIRRTLGDRFRELAQDELFSWLPLELRRRKSKDTQLRKEAGKGGNVL